jgi:6,7-dimethyl-8-ribityllumazine synthase
MGRVIEGKLDARGMRIGIIVSRFNDFVTDRLLQGALEALRSYGGEEGNIDVVRVPGAFEIPLLAHKMAASGKYDAIVCLGAVIRGETPHFEYISDAVTRGVEQAMVQYRVPVSFGVLTTNTVEQAMARAGEKMGNKGFEAAATAIEMATLNREIP